MLINSQNKTNNTNTLNRRISNIAKDLEKSAKSWDKVHPSIGTADRYVGDVANSFAVAERSVDRVQSDDESINSAWHGRELDIGFKFGNRQVGRAESEVINAHSNLNGIQKGVAQGGHDLAAIVNEMKQSNDPRLSTVLEAVQRVTQSQDSFAQSEHHLGAFGQHNQGFNLAALPAQSAIFQIRKDRPGVNVSEYAAPVREALYGARDSLQNMGNDLDKAYQEGRDGQSQLYDVVGKLLSISQGNGGLLTK